MKKRKIIIIVFTILIAILAGLWAYRWIHAEDKFKVICGEWVSMGVESRLSIDKGPNDYRITVYRFYGERCYSRRSYSLYLSGCVAYNDEHGGRVDIFYVSKIDQLLVFPGGKSYHRLTSSPKK